MVSAVEEAVLSCNNQHNSMISDVPFRNNKWNFVRQAA
jgi:hypothetical protein